MIGTATIDFILLYDSSFLIIAECISWYSGVDIDL